MRASAGVYSARQNMLSQVGSVTTNGVQQQTLFVNTEQLNAFGAHDADLARTADRPAVAPGEFPLFSGVRVFHKDYKNPRVYAFNVAYEQELVPDFAGYVDFTWTEGRNLTRFLNYNRSGPSCCDGGPGTGNTYVYSGSPWGPQLGEVMVANSLGESTLPRPHARDPQALLDAATSSRRTTCSRKTRTTTRTSAIRSRIAASTSSISISTGVRRIATSATR